MGFSNKWVKSPFTLCTYLQLHRVSINSFLSAMCKVSKQVGRKKQLRWDLLAQKRKKRFPKHVWLASMVTGRGGDPAATGKKNRAAGIAICEGLSFCRCKQASQEISLSFKKKKSEPFYCSYRRRSQRHMWWTDRHSSTGRYTDCATENVTQPTLFFPSNKKSERACSRQLNR